MFSLLSFTYFKSENTIKNGTYKGSLIRESMKADLGGFNKDIRFSNEVTIKVENDIIKYISLTKLRNVTDKFLSTSFRIDRDGNALAETTNYEQNMENKNDKGHISTYKLIINKKELNK